MLNTLAKRDATYPETPFFSLSRRPSLGAVSDNMNYLVNTNDLTFVGITHEINPRAELCTTDKSRPTAGRRQLPLRSNTMLNSQSQAK